MKVGVVTYCHCLNYGAELQACALQRVLERLGHRAYVIDFDRAPLSAKQKSIKRRRAIVNRIKRHPFSGVLELVDLLQNKIIARVVPRPRKVSEALCIRRSRFEDFWSEYEIHTKKLDGGSLLGLGFDVYIAGSDQIWNWMQTSDMSPYFLMFAERSAKKISYAASLSEQTIPVWLVDEYRKYLTNLDAISVREKQTVDLLQPLTQKKINLVLDPTLLLEKQDWHALWSDQIKIEQPYVFSYTLNASRRFVEIMRAYAKKHGLKIVNIASSCDVPKGAEIINVYDAGPSEFLYLLSKARFVFTNSFHGTIFAINFNVPFLSVLNPASETNSRVLSVAELLGVLDHVVMDDEKERALKAAEVSINFASVNELCSRMRLQSMKFLESAING